MTVRWLTGRYLTFLLLCPNDSGFLQPPLKILSPLGSAGEPRYQTETSEPTGRCFPGLKSEIKFLLGSELRHNAVLVRLPTCHEDGAGMSSWRSACTVNGLSANGGNASRCLRGLWNGISGRRCNPEDADTERSLSLQSQRFWGDGCLVRVQGQRSE